MFYPDNGSNDPHTHALIIGVGGYPYLPDGKSPNPNVITYFGELTQLTSASRTAARFGEWVVGSANRWDVPLGSADLLISPVSGDNFILPDKHDRSKLDIPSCENVQKAYLAWKDRCDRNKDNIALFFFCGHGGQKESILYLLCQDFGASQADVWEGGFDFTRTRDSFHNCKAERQFFFVDSCRQLTLSLLRRDPTASPLEGARDVFDDDCRFNFTQYAAPKNQFAMGPVQGISYYAQALMKAMDGCSAKEVNKQWVITTGRLVDTLEEIASTLDIPPNVEYDPNYGRETNRSSVIMRVALPKVAVTITCRPDDANRLAKLTCQQIGIDNPPQPYTNDGGPWTLDVPVGFYLAIADFDQRYHRDEKMFAPIPPTYFQPLKVI